VAHCRRRLYPHFMQACFERYWPSLGVHWALAGRAVKVAADNLKAFRNAIRMCVPSIPLRKPGCAGLSTDGTPKIFSPTVEDDHPLSMTLRRDHSTPPVAKHPVALRNLGFQSGTGPTESDLLCSVNCRCEFILSAVTGISSEHSSLCALTMRPRQNTPSNSSMVMT
jgi:hypothetical protein